MSKFTGGEWKYLQSPLRGLGGDEQWYLIGSPERAVGFIRHEEDAKLIAAAPEMYRLLESIVSLLSVHSYSQGEAVKIHQLLARIDGEEAEHEVDKERSGNAGLPVAG